MPRRKYGRMIKPLPVTKPEKCRFCKAGRPCPLHKEGAVTPSKK